MYSCQVGVFCLGAFVSEGFASVSPYENDPFAQITEP